MGIEQIWDLFQLPFMQRALLGGVLTGMVGGLLGSFAILRQLSFFSDALGHSALLGIVLGILLGLDPTLVLLPYGVVFALGVTVLLDRSKLAPDAVLNIIYSSSLALSVIALSYLPRYRGNLNQLLFGDILGISERDLWLSGSMLLIAVVVIGSTLRSQMLLTLHESLARAQGVPATLHRILFVVLLSLVVSLSIRSVGVLLVSAFVVIPACTARLWQHRFLPYIGLSMSLGAASAVIGMIMSAGLNLPSGPSIVATQLTLFLATLVVSQMRPASP